MFTIVTTRFTDETKKQNDDYKLTNKMNGCIYGSPQEMSPKILCDSIVFVVEMNNTKNKIEGIGLVRNKPYLDKYYKIYREGNYNRYVYKSEYYIDRETLIKYNQDLVDIFDYILFKEKTHLKRGSGFTTITDKILKKNKNENVNLKRAIREVFINVFKTPLLNEGEHEDDKK